VVQQPGDRGRFGDFRRGDTVTVRSLAEILATLDADAKLDGLPFMPEMAACCGRSFRVYRRADKTCVEGLGMRSMRDTVFLDGLRCDGSAHGGCQRGCLFFWKEAWLEPEREGGRGLRQAQPSRKAKGETGEPDPALIPNPQSLIPGSPALPTTKGNRFYCQSTELAAATRDFPPGTLRHFFHDLRTGELGLRRLAYKLWLALLNRVWRLLRGRAFFDQMTGEQKKTQRAALNLQPGELVEIKSPAEIRATLDARGRNRGLSFDPEMALHCGRRYRVAGPVRQIIAEETGKMVQLTDTVILEGVVCQGICVANCPRANLLYWREIWLKRV
jgi:hypothetical protein